MNPIISAVYEETICIASGIPPDAGLQVHKTEVFQFLVGDNNITPPLPYRNLHLPVLVMPMSGRFNKLIPEHSTKSLSDM